MFLGYKIPESKGQAVQPTHLVAYSLDPANHANDRTPKQQKEVLDFLHLHFKDPADVDKAFFDFRDKLNASNPAADAWNNTDDPVLFWRKQVSNCPIR